MMVMFSQPLFCFVVFAGGPGLYDPCEKEAYDVTATLTNQQREDITALAQVKKKYCFPVFR